MSLNEFKVISDWERERQREKNFTKTYSIEDKFNNNYLFILGLEMFVLGDGH